MNDSPSHIFQSRSKCHYLSPVRLTGCVYCFFFFIAYFFWLAKAKKLLGIAMLSIVIPIPMCVNIECLQASESYQNQKFYR